MKKLIWRVFTVHLLIFFIAAGTVFAAEKKKELEVKVQAGFEGEYKYGYHVPITFEVINDKEDINGEIQFEAENQAKNITIYSKSISILKGERKTYTLNIPLYSSAGFKVRIINGNKKLLEERPTMSYGANLEAYLIGILSDDFDSVNFFSYSNRYSRSAKLNEKNFPKDIDVINMFDTILINNFDTSKLNSEQYSALKKWVNAGGTLILGTGPTHSKSLSIFKDDFISIKMNGIKDIKTNALYDYIGKKEPSPMEISTTDVDIKGSSPYLRDENNILISHVQMGRGKIYIASFDLGLKPIADWDDNKLFGGQMAVNTSSKNYMNPNSQQFMYYGNDNIQGALMTIPDLPNPSPWNFIIISLIYTLLAGPVSYMILKKKDKRGYMWLTVPIISLIFCIIIYSSGLGTRLNKPIANVISLVDITGKENIGLSTLAGIFTPVKKDITVETEEGMNISSIVFSGNDYNYYIQNPNSNAKIVDSKVNYSSRLSVEFLKNKIWSMRTLELQNNDIEIGDFDCKISYKDSKFTGTVKNNTGMDLEECLLLSQDKYIDLGVIKRDEIKTINTPGSMYLDKMSIMRVFNSGTTNIRSSNKMTNEKIIEMRRNQQNQGVINYYLNSSFVDNYPIKLLGIGTTPVAKDIIVDKKAIKKYEKVLLISECSVDFNNGNEIEYPSRYFKPLILNSRFNGYNPYDESYNGRGSIELMYELDENVNITEINFDNHIKNVRSYSSTDVKGYLWNYKTNTWEEGSYNNYTLSGEDISKYVGDNNRIKYKIESKDDALILKLPCISMKGSVE